MPRAKKTIAPLTPAEIKAKKADLKAALKLATDALKPFTAAVKETNTVAAFAKKEADKTVAAAQKSAEVAQAKFAKAKAASDVGVAKIQAQLAALEPVAAE